MAGHAIHPREHPPHRVSVDDVHDAEGGEPRKHLLHEHGAFVLHVCATPWQARLGAVCTLSTHTNRLFDTQHTTHAPSSSPALRGNEACSCHSCVHVYVCVCVCMCVLCSPPPPPHHRRCARRVMSTPSTCTSCGSPPAPHVSGGVRRFFRTKTPTTRAQCSGWKGARGLSRCHHPPTSSPCRQCKTSETSSCFGGCVRALAGGCSLGGVHMHAVCVCVDAIAQGAWLWLLSSPVSIMLPCALRV